MVTNHFGSTSPASMYTDQAQAELREILNGVSDFDVRVTLNALASTHPEEVAQAVMATAFAGMLVSALKSGDSGPLEDLLDELS